MIIDTHSHLNFKAYDNDRDEVVKRTQKEGVVCIDVGTKFETSKRAIELADKNENVYAAIGMHPIHIKTDLMKLKMDEDEGSFAPLGEEFDKTKYFISTDGYFTQNGYTTNVNKVGSGISWDSNSFVNIKGPCDDSGMLCNFTTITAPRYTNELIVDNFGFSIPLTANIISLKIDIRQKTSVCNTYSNIYCSQMKLNVGGIDIGNNMSSSSYFSHTYGTLSPTLQTKMCVETGNYTMYSYSAETTNFGYSLTPSIINNTTFGLGIMYQNDIIGTTNYNTLEIDCVNVDVTYNLPNISTGTTFFASFNRNLKFNTDLSRFGLIDELVYSKVNHIENVLKIKNTEEDLSIYPMIDEFGYTYSSRFIFKSTFDKDYYIQTLNTLK